LRNDLGALNEALQADERTMWKEWSRDRLSLIIATPGNTLAALGDEDPLVRLTAVSIVRRYWPPSQSFAGECLRLTFADPDARVRGAAFLVASRYSSLKLIVDTTGFLRRLARELIEPLPREMLQRAQELLNDTLKKRHEREQRFLAMVKDLTGAHFHEMLSSADKITQCLASQDRNLRLAAIWLIAWYWTKDRLFAATVEQIAFFDSDTDLRNHALDAMTAFYVGTDDRRVGDRLARAVYDEAATLRFRSAAYNGLFIVRGIPRSQSPRVQAVERAFFELVDWKFVDSFLSEDS
jgi:hypothetical protein